MGTPVINLDQLIDDIVTENVAVAETSAIKQEVLAAVFDAQSIADGLDANIVSKKIELDTHTISKIQELEIISSNKQLDIITLTDTKELEFNVNAVDKTNQYNANDIVKVDQYNYNHMARLENINSAYADRIVQMIKTRNFMGIMDEYVAQVNTHMITFLSTEAENYIYYGNGVLLELDVDYTVYDATTIELVIKANPYDVIVQINTGVLRDMLTAEDVLFESHIGIPNGVASLDENALVPSAQLPSYVDDVLEFATYADLPIAGETGKIYVVVTDGTSGDNTSSYRWTGTIYAMVSNTLTATDVKGLYESNTDTNVYTDIAKNEVDTITSRLSNKQDNLVSGINIKTINGDDVIGPGNLLVSAGASGYAANVYLTSQVSSTVATYKQLSYIPETNETVLITTVDDSAEVLVEEYIFDGDVLADFIPAGEWQFSFTRRVSNIAGETYIKFVLYSRTMGGVETDLFEYTTNSIEDTVYVRESLVFIQSSYSVNFTDRIGLKVYVGTTRNSPVSCYIKVGNGDAAYLVTPLGLRHNQLRARDEVDSHSINAITGLEDTLATLQESIDTITEIQEW